MYTFRLEPISEVLCVQWTLTVMSKCLVYFWLVCSQPSKRTSFMWNLSWFPLEKEERKRNRAVKCWKTGRRSFKYPLKWLRLQFIHWDWFITLQLQRTNAVIFVFLQFVYTVSVLSGWKCCQTVFCVWYIMWLDLLSPGTQIFLLVHRSTPT